MRWCVQAAGRTISLSLFQGLQMPSWRYHSRVSGEMRPIEVYQVPRDVSFLGFALGGPRFLHFVLFTNRTKKETVVHIYG